MKLKTLVVAALAVFSSLSYADESGIKNTDDMADVLIAAYLSIDGQEVNIDGVVGTLSSGGQLYFQDETGRFVLALDAGREVRRQLEGCELARRDALTSSPCKITGMAEAKIDRDDKHMGDGIEIELILYQVDSFNKQK